MNNKQREAQLADLGLVLFLSGMSLMTTLFLVESQRLLSVIYLLLTMMLLLTAFLYGLKPALIANLIFIGIQLLVATYTTLRLGRDLLITQYVWLVVPLVLIGSFELMTRMQRQLKNTNRALIQALNHYGLVDQMTKLRTATAFNQDAAWFLENYRQFDLPVTLSVYQIQYHAEVKHLLNRQEYAKLVQQISAQLMTTVTDNEMVYYTNPYTPTWVVMQHKDETSVQQQVEQVKQVIVRQLSEDEQFKTVSIQMIAGVAGWVPQTMTTPKDLLTAGMTALTYDRN